MPQATSVTISRVEGRGSRVESHAQAAQPAVSVTQLSTLDSRPLRPDPSRWQIAVKSFRRFDALQRFVSSVLHYYPDAEILIADDSFEDLNSPPPPIVRHLQSLPGVTWYQLPFDSGLSAGRRFLTEQATAEFVLQCDDDFVFQADTCIEQLLDVLDSDASIDLAAGVVRFDGLHPITFGGDFANGFDHRPPSRAERVTPQGTPYQPVDLVHNFYLARPERLLETAPWDDRLKVCEHRDFFRTAKDRGLGVCYTPASVVGHLRDWGGEYDDFRQRKEEHQQILREKWGMDELPRTPAVPIPTANAVNVAADARQQRGQQRPNLIVFGIGHSGTSIATKLLLQLGWHCPDADEEFAEHVGLREINDRLLWKPVEGRESRVESQTQAAQPPVPRPSTLDPRPSTQIEMTRVIEQLPEPWILKDPRLLHTIDAWLPLLEDARPTLLWLTRNLDDVAASYRRRGEGGDGPEVVFRGLTLSEAYREAARVYRDWPWGKLQISYENIRQAIALFDVDRSDNRG